MVGYEKRQSYKRNPKPYAGKKVDIFLSGEIFELYRQKLMFEKGVRGGSLKIFEFDKKLKESKSRIRDADIRENINYLLEIINDNCPLNLNGINMEKAVNEFQDYLRKNTGQSYEINLVIGNL
ncbi:hypothetical protein D4Q76_00355 [archaeon]|nr:MAG: hypothetical protein D4Q76_00355 [archaeon]